MTSETKKKSKTKKAKIPVEEVTLLRLREMAREDSGKSSFELNGLKQMALRKLLKNRKAKISINNFDYKITYDGETKIFRNFPQINLCSKFYKQ